jgi:hypothetical protein
MQNIPISANSLLRTGQFACFIAAVAVFYMAIGKLPVLAQDAGQILIGILAASSCALLLVVVGLLLPIVASIEKAAEIKA